MGMYHVDRGNKFQELKQRGLRTGELHFCKGHPPNQAAPKPLAGCGALGLSQPTGEAARLC